MKNLNWSPSIFNNIAKKKKRKKREVRAKCNVYQGGNCCWMWVVSRKSIAIWAEDSFTQFPAFLNNILRTLSFTNLRWTAIKSKYLYVYIIILYILYIYLYISWYICIHTQIYTFAHMYTYMHIYLYLCIHTYTHIFIFFLVLGAISLS